MLSGLYTAEEKKKSIKQNVQLITEINLYVNYGLFVRYKTLDFAPRDYSELRSIKSMRGSSNFHQRGPGSTDRKKKPLTTFYFPGGPGSTERKNPLTTFYFQGVQMLISIDTYRT